MSTDANKASDSIKSSDGASKRQQKKEQKLVLGRYSALVGLWSHHNTLLFQWSPIIISASLLVISLVVHVPGITSM